MRRDTVQVTGESPEVLQETAVGDVNSSASPAGAGNSSGFTLKVLYLFAGAERKTSVVECLRRLTKDAGWRLEAQEIDLKRGSGFDLTQEQLQSKVLADIAAGLFHCVICTPPLQHLVTCPNGQPARPTASAQQGASVGVPMGEAEVSTRLGSGK